MATAKKVKLNKNARAWVKALRSGKYKQTKSVLTAVSRDTGEITGHCCLGVLCELAKAAGVKLKTMARHGCIYYDQSSSLPPKKVTEWAGLSSFDGRFVDKKERGGINDLTNWNDSGKSFKQIARIIEQKAAELFV